MRSDSEIKLDVKFSMKFFNLKAKAAFYHSRCVIGLTLDYSESR